MSPVKVKAEINKDVREVFAEYDDLTARLLAARGISSKGDAHLFLNPDYERDTHDPFLMLGMDRAVDRIFSAIEGKEKITVFSDYDCDGIPGGALLHDALKKLGAYFTNYIPHRNRDRYGMSVEAVEKLHAGGTKLIITVDCGITDVEPVVRARELGIEVIISDHHLPHGELPPAYAILNPKREHCTYPFKELCGTGVAYKLAQALAQKSAIDPKGWEKWLLDLVAIATVADLMELSGENRALVRFGLLVLRKSRRPGLLALCKKMGVMQRAITEDDVSFMIAPRVNAASRMDDPELAFRLLTTEDPVEAEALASELEALNRSRRTAVATITKEVKRRLAAKSSHPSVIVLGDPAWRPALLGLVANSVVEEYGRPVFLWGREHSTVIKGSCRSDGTVNLVSLMEEARGTFLEFGGHAFSGGFSLTHESVLTFESQLLSAHETVPKEEGEREERFVDGVLAIEDLSDILLRTLEQFAPFGMGNEKPLFHFPEVRLREVVWFGKGEEHLKLRCATERGTREAIAFFAARDLGEEARSVRAGQEVSLLGNVERDTRTRVPRIRIVDILS
jgi:single-stranded-DNA-specific exonuclease